MRVVWSTRILWRKRVHLLDSSALLLVSLLSLLLEVALVEVTLLEVALVEVALVEVALVEVAVVDEQLQRSSSSVKQACILYVCCSVGFGFAFTVQ